MPPPSAAAPSWWRSPRDAPLASRSCCASRSGRSFNACAFACSSVTASTGTYCSLSVSTSSVSSRSPIARSSCRPARVPRVLRHQQPLPVVGQLHPRPRDLDARAGARRLLILGLLQHRFRERHVGLRRLHVRIRPHRRQVGPRHLRRHLLRASVHIRLGRAHPHLRRLKAPVCAEVENDSASPKRARPWY